MMITSHPKALTRRRQRVMTALAAVAATPLLLAGCTADSGGAPSDGSIGGTLTYWKGMDTVDDETTATAEKLFVTPFTDRYPAVDFQLIPQADEGLQQKMQTALAAGQGPDFVETPGSATAIPYAQAGYLADLDDLADEEGWKDSILPWALDMGVIDDKLVAIPTTYETLVLYYNKTLFDANGWEAPTDRDSLEEIASKAESKGIIPFAAGNADYKGATEWVLSAYLNQVAGAGTIHDALAGDLDFTDPAIVSAVQLMIDDFEAGWYGGGVEKYFSTTDPQRYAGLATGDSAMYISGSWDIEALNEYFDESGQEWGWVSLPALADGVTNEVYPLSVGGTMSINSATRNLPAAEAYLAWLFSDTESNWAAVEAGEAGILPVEFDATAAPADVDPRLVEQYQSISDSSVDEQVGYVTWTSFGGSMEAYVLENQDRLLTGDLSAKDFCAGLAAAYDRDVADNTLPPLFGTAAR
jgi:raffinose/stachyose/melibiose transport system substrate-binding protein